MGDLGFKQLSAENWLVQDSIMDIFGQLTPDGNFYHISGEEWLRDILQPKIDEAVPIEIRQLFEVARGAMAYGIFFYPIYTLGIEQLLRVVETAVVFKCRSMNAPSKIDTFEKRINWLIEKNIIPQNRSNHWEGVRMLRNDASHPQMQSIFMPTEALKYIESTAKDINSLFTSP